MLITDLLSVEFQLLWGNTEPRLHKATGYVHRHDGLSTALLANDAVAHQTFFNDLQVYRSGPNIWCHVHEQVVLINSDVFIQFKA